MKHYTCDLVLVLLPLEFAQPKTMGLREDFLEVPIRRTWHTQILWQFILLTY